MRAVRWLSGRVLNMKGTRFAVVDRVLGAVDRRGLVGVSTEDCRSNLQSHVWRWFLSGGGDEEEVVAGRFRELVMLREVAVQGVVFEQGEETESGEEAFDWERKRMVQLLHEAPRLVLLRLMGVESQWLVSSVIALGGFSRNLTKVTLSSTDTDLEPWDLPLLGTAAPGIKNLALQDVIAKGDLSVGFENLVELTVIGGFVPFGDTPPLARNLVQSLPAIVLSQLTTLRLLIGLENKETEYYRFNGTLAVDFLRVFAQCGSLEALDVAFGRIKIGHLALILKCVGSKLRTLRVGRVLDSAFATSIPWEDHVHTEVRRRGNDAFDFQKEWAFDPDHAAQPEDRVLLPLDLTEHQKGEIRFDNLPQDDRFWPSQDENFKSWQHRAVSLLRFYCPRLEWVHFWTQLGPGPKWNEPLVLERDGLRWAQMRDLSPNKNL
ncbi:hypothetical protein HDU98_002410 [Podochytrium sp. JEL0797]|nr:hypothetical protein HDU98_002410 [Podochytrium sp. JEL0797]